MMKRDHKGRFIKQNLNKRLSSKFKKDKSGCWIWIAQNVKGYGRIRINGKLVLAHRVMWELKNRKIPNNLDVLHKCDNPSCINPNHLWIGTHQDNMRDRDLKKRGNNRYTVKN